MGSFALNSLERSLTPNLLDSRFDHDSCGVGFVATLRNQPTHEILTQALTALARLAHRGAIAADGKSSDGVGIMTAVPRQFLLDSTGISLEAGKPLGVGVVFFPSEFGPGQQALDRALTAQNLEVLAWRVVPTREEVLGEIALSSIPVIRQVLVTASEPAHFERRLYLARKQFERDTHASGYVCSLSSCPLVYKAMCAGRLLAEFYPDLADPNYTTAFAIFHQRYATNVLPSWDRAQPLRTLAHNGEINTVWGNRGRMDARAATIPRSVTPSCPRMAPIPPASTRWSSCWHVTAEVSQKQSECCCLRPAGRKIRPSFATTRIVSSPGTAQQLWLLPTVTWSVWPWIATVFAPAASSLPKMRWSLLVPKRDWWTSIRKESSIAAASVRARCWWPIWTRTSCSKTICC